MSPISSVASDLTLITSPAPCVARDAGDDRVRLGPVARPVHRPAGARHALLQPLELLGQRRHRARLDRRAGVAQRLPVASSADRRGALGADRRRRLAEIAAQLRVARAPREPPPGSSCVRAGTMRSHMMPTELPQGRYLSCGFASATDCGRPDARAADAQPDPRDRGRRAAGACSRSARRPTTTQRRERLREQGLLLDGDRRCSTSTSTTASTAGATQEPTGPSSRTSARTGARGAGTPDGTPWRDIYRLPGRRSGRSSSTCAPTGRPYLRIPAFSLELQGLAGAGRIQMDRRGRRGRRRVRDARAMVPALDPRARRTSDERAFVFMDSRFVVPHLVPMRGRRFHLIYLMHNLHVGPPRRWDSRGQPRLQARAVRIDGHGRDGHADRAPARRHRRAAAGGRATCSSSRTRSRCRSLPRPRRRATRTG